MTDETLDRIICRINKDGFVGQAFLQPLTDTVSFGRVWPDLPTGRTFPEEGYRMFFIRGNGGPYIGTVLDMGEADLHIYVRPGHRKRGHMRTALREVILPYLFNEGRPQQHVTFKLDSMVEYLEKTGFQVSSNKTAVIAPSNIEPSMTPELRTVAFQPARAKEIKYRVRHAAALLKMAIDELNCAGKSEMGSYLNDAALELTSLAFDIEDLAIGH